MEILARPRGLWNREMSNAFLPGAPSWLHSIPPSPRGNHVCFPQSGTLGGPCWQTLDVHADTEGLYSLSSQGLRATSSRPQSQVEGTRRPRHGE